MVQKFGFLIVLISIFFAFVSKADSKDSHSMIYLGKGTKLLLKKDLAIPANAGRLRFPLPGKYNDACYLDIRPSVEDRRMSAGREIVLSGKVLEVGETFISVEVERPQDITGILCTNTWDGQISIGMVKTAFADHADIVFPEPSELPE